jgi:hypothetical protein
MVVTAKIRQRCAQDHREWLPKGSSFTGALFKSEITDNLQYNTKGKSFVLRRQDLDVTVLPTKYISELRTIPNAQLSRGKANFMVFHTASI